MNLMQGTRMSCWVAPSLAAELWHITLEQVMNLIRDGQLAVKMDQGFTFVDIAPREKPQQPQLRRPEDRPATFTPITDDELAALSDETDLPDDTQSEEMESGTLGDWRTARLKAGRMRRPPRRVPA